VAPPAAQPAEADDESASPETTAADPPETGDATVSVAPSDRFLSETNLTFDDPVAFDTVANWMDELLREHTGREAFFKLTNPDHVAGSGTLHDKWTVQLPLPVAEATPLLAKFQDELNSKPLFPLSNEIGGRVAERMQQLAALSIVFSLICIVGYIWLRFQRVEFGLAAVVALVHDVLVTLGMIAVSAYVVEFAGPLARVLRIESFQISLPIVAAFLTIIGYSLNDTIVVFDRIREVRGKSPDLTGEMVNTSINQTLSRTLLTSLTTFIVVVILYAVGGAGIHGFAFALVIGVLVGTYSSIFVASPVLLWMSTPRKKVAARA
jgi:SecD/SecF fusion protein